MVKASPLLLYFNPRTHVGCDHNTHIETVPSGDFNPRTHVGCDILSAAIYEERKISIHAPTWGATCTPTLMSKINEISIHAPTWGATFSGRAFSARSLFQSTHPRGVRPRLSADTWVVLTFQSTHPRGVRQLGFLLIKINLNFNPRTHVGCDGYRVFSSDRPILISIHAPTWGATLMSKGLGKSFVISIHAPTWGATFRIRVVLTSLTNFNPRTHVGCDVHSMFR